MKNKYLETIAANRETTFDDILTVITQTCEAKVRRAVQNSDHRIESIIEKLIAEKCGYAYSVITSDGAGDRLDRSVVFGTRFEQGELEGLSVVVACLVIVESRKEDLDTVLLDRGSIRFKSNPEREYDFETLKTLYAVRPEAFNVRDFCD